MTNSWNKKIFLAALLILFLGLYTYVYFNLTYFVFFNFDMPRVALIVQDFLRHGTFLTSQNYFEESVWRNIPWGPSMVFFYAVFLKLTNNPLIISYMLSVVNLGAILFLVAVLWKHFGKSLAIATAFLLATNPYWVTYVRIIYQPSPITFFIPISMAIFFEAAFNKKWWACILLPVSWIVLFQVYIPTYSFILTSFVFLLFLIKKSELKYYALGILLSLILLFPSVIFLNSHREYLNRYVDAPSLFTPQEKTFLERLEKVSLSFALIPVGGVFEHQTGYGYNDFVQNYLPSLPWVTFLLAGILIMSLGWNLGYIFVKKDYKRAIILLWAICPLWSMVILWVSDILPRYYLLAFPSIMIMIALFLTDLSHRSKFFWIFIGAIVIYWILFNFSYNKFIYTYDYPNGRFRDVAETPYIFLDKAIGWVINDAKQKKCNPVVSNNEQNPNFDVWIETKYIWKYIYNRSLDVQPDTSESCYYIINYKNKVRELGVTDYEVFGLFTVFNYDSIKN